MVRPIDSYTLNNELLSWYNDTEDETEKSILRCVMQMVVHAPTLTPPNEWVSVEERLPEPTYCVLVYTTDYSIEVDARGSDGEWMSHEVTHWMPLPAPPDRRPPEGELKYDGRL